MAKIKTIYVCNHAHTDIGFTDYQDLALRQHGEFVEQALDLIEATDGYPAAARYRWTVETSGPFLRYLRRADPGQVRRFRHWHDEGRIDIAAMQYNFTPLLNVEQMHRSLYPLRAIRDEFGFKVEAAMQDDVNGVSWLFADLLADLGIDFYTAAINPIRGARPSPFPGAFRWEGPSGKTVLAWNGYHYLFGRSQAGLGNWDLVDRLLPHWVAELEADPTYPFDFLYCESTHPVRVDNGPPDGRMPDFVKRWNGEERPWRIEFINVTDFGRLLEARHASVIGTQRGDWTDHWADGVGSSALEVGVNRAAHELIGMGESLEAWLRSRGKRGWDAAHAAHIYEQTNLFDEHTWGAYSSVEAPYSLFSMAQWNRKAGYAYAAAMEGHNAVARAANALAAPLGDKGPEGIFNLGNLTPEEAFKPSGIDDLLVINTLPWEREVIVEEPEPRGGAAPVGVLDTFFNRGSSWGGPRPFPAIRRVAGTIPSMGYKFLSLKAGVPADDLKVGPGVLENRHYRLRIDPATGGIAELFDKALGHDFAGSYLGWQPGQYIYETVDSPQDRLAIADISFDKPEFFTGHKDTPWRREIATRVELGEATIREGRAALTVTIAAPGVSAASVTYALDAQSKSVVIDWSIDKLAHDKAEAVFIAFPFKLEAANFLLDLNGIPAVPNADQLDGAAKDWYPVGRWVDVSDAHRGVTLVPLDAPLVHLGGITTGKWDRTLHPEGPTIMSWALNNHWLVNFKSSQSGRMPLRYRLTTHAGPADATAAARFAAEAAVPPITLRDIRPTGATSDSFFSLDAGAPVLVTSKPGEDAGWVVLRLQNLNKANARPVIRFTVAPSAARSADPLEHPGTELTLEGPTLAVDLAPLEIRTVLVRFPAQLG